MPTITLTLPVAGQDIDAGPIATNFADLQALLNGGLDASNWASGKIFAPSKLTQEGATSGQGLAWNGSAWVPTTIAQAIETQYAQITANASITATTEGTANTIVTAGAFTPDGVAAYLIKFFAPLARSANSTSMQYFLYDGASSIGQIGQTDTDASGNGHPVHLERRFVPTNASHTYSIRAKVTSGTGTVFAGAGGLGTMAPAFIQIIKVT